MKYIVLIPAYEPDDKLIKLLKTIPKNVDTIIVNDGSNHNYDDIFNVVKKYAQVISYDVNMGKGYALKEGMKYIQKKYKNYIIVCRCRQSR